MAYSLYTGQRLEDLVEENLPLFSSRFFEPQPWIVLQNQSLAQWLKLFLAEKLGAYATGEFTFADTAVRTLLEDATEAEVSSKRVLFMDDLKTSLFFLLSDILNKRPEKGDPYGPLRDFLGEADFGRIFEIADHTAGLFHSYGMNSFLLPRAFETGVFPAYLPSSLRADWGWQEALWTKVYLKGDSTHAGLKMAQAALSPPPASMEPRRIILVGSAFLSRRAGEFFRSWADSGVIDVHHLLLLPSFLIPGLPDRRPWSSWGRFGRAFLDGYSTVFQKTSKRETRSSSTFLTLLQDSLSAGEALPSGTLPDPSFSIYSCVHPLRELEVLKDRLLTVLDESPELKLNEIAVLAPDINVYTPFLDAVFESEEGLRKIPYNVIDLDLSKELPFFTGLEALMGLLEGDIERPLLFQLLQNPCCQASLGVDAAEVETWLELTDKTSSFREKASEIGRGGPQTWQNAWARLWQGTTWGNLESIDWESDSFFPLDASQSQVVLLGKFFDALQDLKALARRTAENRSFLEWIHLLEEAVRKFLGDEGNRSWLTLSARLFTLARDLREDDRERGFGWSGFRAMVQDQVSHTAAGRGRLLTEGVHFSSLKPLRSLPFQVIAVLGLDEKNFPKRSPALSFDLSVGEPGQEDLSSQSLERYSFWETLMSARRNFWLFYRGRDPQTGQDLPPSSVISDLLDYFEVSGLGQSALQSLVQVEPLHAFSASALERGTYSLRAVRQGNALSSDRPSLRVKLEKEVHGLPWVGLFTEVDFFDLSQAFRTPALFHLRRIQGISLEKEDLRSVEDEEPWEGEFWESQSFLETSFWESFVLRGEKEPESAVEEFFRLPVGRGLIPRGPFLQKQKTDLEARLSTIQKRTLDLRQLNAEVSNLTDYNLLWAGLPLNPEVPFLHTETQRILVDLRSGEKLPFWRKIEQGLKALILTVGDSEGQPVRLENFSKSGESRGWTWSVDDAVSAKLYEEAQEYWKVCAREALPFYPDYCEKVEGLLSETSTEEKETDWPLIAEEAWNQVAHESVFSGSKTLKTCPYAHLAFSGELDFAQWGELLKRFWPSVFVPLLKGWEKA